jgi:hypothetical protein
MVTPQPTKEGNAQVGSRNRRQPLCIFPAGPPDRASASKVMAVALRPILPM